jgi:crotonobetainyl-CoA:carnitine CoA-transferase CaiB-like acyl-CoA transferase
MVCAIGSDAFVKIYESIGRQDLATEYAGDDEEAFEKRSLMLNYLNSEFAHWTVTKTAEEIMSFFEAIGVPCGVVKDVGELLEDPQLLARNMVVDIDHPVLGQIKTFNNPVVFLDAQSQVLPGENQLDPKLGEHTGNVLTRLLNLNDADLEKLKKDEVIWI